ncbi:MAG: hypothetical protein ACK5MK_08300 [Dysgonomonas sp.]
MNATNRIEVEMKVREAAIQIAQIYGKEGVRLFHSQFLSIAEEYADNYEGERAKMQSIEHLIRKE